MKTHWKALTGTILLVTSITGCASTSDTGSLADRTSVVTYDRVEWGALNPARGDKSPRAGKLWGDRTKDEASGFLVRFDEGFSSPPHIHNITYRGVVIEGLVHNDDPDAEQMWLGRGSFWTQPAGDVHITSADGAFNMAYIEIDEGPYLVQPTEDAFHDDEVSINVDESNLVWLDATSMTWIDADRSGAAHTSAQVATLWGNPQDGQPYGTMMKLPPDFDGVIRSTGNLFRAVVIQGELERSATLLTPGSYFGSDAPVSHHVQADGQGEVLVYVRTDAPYRIIRD